IMGRHLQKNICGLPIYGINRTKIDDDCIARSLPPALQYVAPHWVYHLDQSSALIRSLDQVSPLLKGQFLH
ncbi:hypothetical protein V8F44DRAFT_488240, partial [Aspergillus fumigatus]